MFEICFKKYFCKEEWTESLMDSNSDGQVVTCNQSSGSLLEQKLPDHCCSKSDWKISATHKETKSKSRE